MARRLDIGIASYMAPEKLRRTVEAVKEHSTTDWRLRIVHNPCEGDDATREVIDDYYTENPRIGRIMLPENVGYCGAVNTIFEEAGSEYIAYLDNDAYVQTPGWDEILCSYLDRFHEIGMIFPNSGAYPIPRAAYTEVQWAAGFCFVVNRLAMKDVGLMDTTLGHQEDPDYCLRMRMAGYRVACAPEVEVLHDATATNNPASIERINRGVVNFVNKWNRYFNGENFNYHSPNVTRWEDWPVNALYMEEWWKLQRPDLNINPNTFTLPDGREYDEIIVPRLAGFYRGRVI